MGYRTFLQLSHKVLREVAAPLDRATVFEVQEAINDALGEIVQYNNWNFLLDRYDIPLVASYTTGTATFTQGSTSFSGLGTTWNTGWFNRKIIISGDSQEKEVLQFTSANAGTLRFPFNSTATVIAGVPYTIYQDEYPLPISSGRDLVIINPILRYRLKRPPRYTFEDRVVWSRFFGASPRPVAYTDAGADWNSLSPTAGQPRIRIWPAGFAAQDLQLYFYKTFTKLLLDTDKSILPEEFDELLIDMAVARLRKTFGVPGWLEDSSKAKRRLIQFRQMQESQSAMDYMTDFSKYPELDPWAVDQSLVAWPGTIG